MIKVSSRHGGRRTAASVVEFAFIAGVFFLMLLGILEYARFLFTIQLVNNAAREGARYAVVNVTTTTTSGVQNYVDGCLYGQGANQLVSYDKTSSITVYKADPTTGQNTGLSWQNATWGDAIGVSITGTYQPLTPGILKLSGNITVTGTAVMTTEDN